MSSYKAFSTNVEVNGETVLSVVEGMGAFRNSALKILAENGIKDPVPGKWYPQQAWLNAFKQIAEKVGKSTLMQIGMKIPENAKFPPDIDDLDKALSSLDFAYHMNHRGGNIGNYNYEKVDNKTIKMTCNNPYPCGFDKGIIQSIAKKFGVPNKPVYITHSENEPCREKGEHSCTFLIQH
ncbi:MAG: hypothetical protein V1773_06440 [bacterium]